MECASIESSFGARRTPTISRGGDLWSCPGYQHAAPPGLISCSLKIGNTYRNSSHTFEAAQLQHINTLTHSQAALLTVCGRISCERVKLMTPILWSSLITKYVGSISCHRMPPKLAREPFLW